MDEVVREDERNTLPLDPELGLEVPKDVPKIDVKELEGYGTEAEFGSGAELLLSPIPNPPLAGDA